jgi:2-keto-4-pentenoate hydratase/2-oxohepta-3-ene-1,7-dioic acid hydratase in catechol pathway
MQLVTFKALGTDDDRRGAAGQHSMGDRGLGFEAFESTTPGARRLGALLSIGSQTGAVVDLNRALAVKLAGEDVGAPEAEADSLLPPDALSFLRDGARALAAARDAFAFAADALDRYDGPDLLRAGVVEPRRRVRLCAPVPRPGKIVGIASNYPSNGPPRNGDARPEPLLFLEAPSAVIGPDDDVVLPAASQRVDYGGTLAVVIGRRTRAIAPAEALGCVAGYCVASDLDCRDQRGGRGQHFIGRSCDTFTPIGPALVTSDEVPDPQALAIRTTLSGEVVQSGSTKEMVHTVAEILAFVSRLVTLEPGDVVLTGTPGGIGASRRPPRWLRDGDVIDVDVEGLGRLCSHVRRER